MPDVVVAGTACLDLLPAFCDVPLLEPGRLLEVGPIELRAGGCVSNTGRVLARLGEDVAASCCVGDDALGEMVVAALDADGVDTAGVRRLARAATSYSVVVQSIGWDRSFLHHPGANTQFDDVEIRAARLLHLGYPSLLPALLAGDGEPLLALLTAARRAGATVSVDFAAVPRSERGRNWEALLRRLLPLCDVVTPSRSDLLAMLPAAAELDDRARAELLLGQGAGVVMLTLGEEGLLLAGAGAGRLEAGGAALSPLAATWADSHIELPARRGVERGTTAAGDAAAAGLLHGILRGRDPVSSAGLAAAAGAAAVAGSSGLARAGP